MACCVSAWAEGRSVTVCCAPRASTGSRLTVNARTPTAISSNVRSDRAPETRIGAHPPEERQANDTLDLSSRRDRSEGTLAVWILRVIAVLLLFLSAFGFLN